MVATVTLRKGLAGGVKNLRPGERRAVGDENGAQATAAPGTTRGLCAGLPCRLRAAGAARRRPRETARRRPRSCALADVRTARHDVACLAAVRG